MNDIPVRMDRSYLYAPTSNHRILAKVLERGADAVILDLEDSVSIAGKPGARVALGAFLDHLAKASEAPPSRVLVRINRDGDGWAEDDLQVAVHPAVTSLSLPKAESAQALVATSARVAELEAERGIPVGTIRFHLLVESALGVENLEDVARVERVERLGLGAADLQADLGIPIGARPAALDHVRGRMVVASRAAGIAAPVDSVHIDLEDLDGLAAAAARSRDFGFFGKSCVHPSQVAVVNEVFSPTDAELDWASAVVSAAHEADARGDGVTVVRGQMIDAPVLARAQSVLRLAASRTKTEESDQ